MNATIVNFRGGRHTQTGNQMVLHIEGVDSIEAAEKLVGKEVVWSTPARKDKKELKGKISAAHGNNGAVRAIFETGMPGQSVGQKVQIK